MIRDPDFPRPDRANPSSGASDLGLYGAGPVLLTAPILATLSPPSPVNAQSLPTPASAATENGVVASLATGWWAPPGQMTAMAPGDAASAKITISESDPAKGAEPGKDIAVHTGSAPPPTPQSFEARSETDGRDTGDASGGDAPGAVAAIAPLSDVPTMASDLDGRIEAVGAAMEARIAAIEDVIAGRTQAIETIVDGLSEDIAAEIGQAKATVDLATAEIAGRVDAIGAELEDQVATLSGTVGASLGAVSGMDLEGLTGGNPAGGITTLVQMVSAADMFGLPDIGAGMDDIAPPNFGDGLDGLMADLVPSDVLLAMPDDHHGALGLLSGLTDDLHP